MKNAVNVPKVSNKQKKQKLFFVIILKDSEEKANIRILIRNPEVRIRGSGSVSNVTDPVHWYAVRTGSFGFQIWNLIWNEGLGLKPRELK